MIIPQKEIKKFQKDILDWYKKNKRDLPWRKTRDPYKILVSEIMSQQTQIARVVPKYEAWIKAFPTVEDLANTKTSEILQYWSGLGYNRRALYLQKCAKEIVKKFGGKFPKAVDQLKKLSGIGEYTSAAIACFAFDQQVAVVDTNIRKIILTQFGINHDTKPRDLQNIADQLLPKGNAYEWNQALMDYAGGMLKKEKIPVPKQSKFKDSDRYYRGQIIKLLLAQHVLPKKTLEKQFSIETKRLEKIIQSLVKDQVIALEQENLTIKEAAFV